jgi:endo-1,4-beta-xylanase
VGFSAGGELAAQAGMKFDNSVAGATDPVEQHGSKPAFQALIYPGNSKAIIPLKDSPPAFLACGYGDRQDISEGLASVYLLFKKAAVPADLHIYAGAGHGFGYRENNKGPAGAWIQHFYEFLGDRKLLTKP